MRIALIVPGFSADEDDWCIPALRNLVSRLVLTDDVRVFALRYPSSTSRYIAFGAEVIPFGAGTGRRLRAVDLWRHVMLGVWTEHRRRPFDVIHAFWADETGMVAAMVGRLLRVPTVVSLAGGELVGYRDIDYGGQLALVQRVKTDAALRLASAITVGSRYQYDLAARLTPRRAGRIVVRPLGVDIERFRPLFQESPDERIHPGSVNNVRRDANRTVLSVASLVGVKDHVNLIDALGRARDLGQSFQLELVGDGPLRPALAELANRLRVIDLIRFRGAIDHHRLPDVYRAAALFVVGSRHEAECLAALEAACAGVAVVGTKVGVVPDLASAGGAVPTHDPAALVAAILSFFDHRSGRSGQAKISSSQFASEFGVVPCTARFRELYQTVAERSGL